MTEGPTGPNRISSPWEIEFWADDDGAKPVLRWIRQDLTPTQRRALGTALRRVLQAHGTDVCSSQWGKALGGGLYEFRVRLTGKQAAHMGAVWRGDPGASAEIDKSEQILLRVMFAIRGDHVLLLLSGYDKGSDSSQKRQNREIATARKRLKHHDNRAARRRRAN